MVAPARTLIAVLGLLTLAGLGEATAQVGVAEALLSAPKAKSKHGRLDSILNGVVEAYARDIRLATKDSGRAPLGEDYV